MKRTWIMVGLAVGLTLVGFSCAPPPNGNTNGNQTNDNVSQNENENGTSGPVPEGFENATAMALDEAHRLIVNSSIDVVDEVDVYDLGSLNAGDFVDVICVATGDGTLDPMVAIFDVDGERVYWNDDIDAEHSNFASSFNGYIHHGGSHYYVAVASSGFPATQERIGAYRLTVQVQPNAGSPAAIGQTVLLYWQQTAGAVEVGGLTYAALPAFDATVVNASFTGQTDALKTAILAHVQQAFGPYDVTFATTDDSIWPTDRYSVVYFGTNTTQNILSASDGIDFFNGNDQDRAIIFVEPFGEFCANVDQAGIAIGNVVVREVGQLLGLMPTNAVGDAMDSAHEGTTLFNNREFGVAPMLDFPIGEQNAPLLLEETVGLHGGE